MSAHIEPDSTFDNGDQSGSTVVAYVPWNWIAPLKSIKHFPAMTHPDWAEEQMQELVLA